MPHPTGDAPCMEDCYALTEAQTASYQRNGHILLRRVASPSEIDVYRPRIAEHVNRSAQAAVAPQDRDAYHRAFVQVANLWETDPIVARFTRARRFARIAAELMGVDAVRLYHDQALFKEAGGGQTFWHQDQYYWPLDTEHMITMWMPLVDVPVEMGALKFATGSHVDGPLCNSAISSDSDSALRAVMEQREYPVSVESMRAGDATFHSGWSVHAAGPNKASKTREAMAIIYYADGAKLVEPDNPHRPADLKRWFPGRVAGEPAASELNPLLYSAVSS